MIPLGEKVLLHFMRIYAIEFFLFGLTLLLIPNFVMDVLGLPHVEGYFWGLNMFAYLTLMAVLALTASRKQELIKFVTFTKFFSASIFLVFSLVLLNFGLLFSGLVDFTLGIGIIVGKRI